MATRKAKQQEVSVLTTQEQADRFYVACMGYGPSYQQRGIDNESRACQMYVAVDKEGSSGGNCWGGRASSYYNDDYEDEAVSDMISAVKYVLTQCAIDLDTSQLDALSEDIGTTLRSGGHDTYTDSGDYYGNSSTYASYGYPLDKLIPFVFGTSPHLEEIKARIEELKAAQLAELTLASLKERLTELQGQLKRFETTKKQERDTLVRSISSQEKNLAKSRQDLVTFEARAEKERSSLEGSVKHLTTTIAKSKR